MAIGNDTGSGTEYEVQPSSGPPPTVGENFSTAAPIVAMSMALSVGAGLATLFGCLGGGGKPLVLLGLGLLAGSLLLQGVAYGRLRRAGRSLEPRNDGPVQRSAQLGAATGSGSQRVFLGPYESHDHVTFAVDQIVIFWEPESGDHLATSKPVQSTVENVRLKQEKGQMDGMTTDGGYSVEQTT